MPSHLPPENHSAFMSLRSRSQGIVITETFIYCVLILMALVGNSLVLWIVYKNRSLRTIPNYFVISLACTDIGMALFGTPWTVGVLATGRWPFDFAACQIQGFIVIWLAVSSLQNLNIMAINRYCRIVKPNVYRRLFTPKRTRLYILGAYCIAAVSPMPYIIGGNVFIFIPGKAFCYQKNMAAYTLPLMLVAIGVPTCIIILCYFQVFTTLRTHRRNLLKTKTQSNTPRITVEDIRITKTLFATVVGFLLCWMPVLVIEMVDLGINDSLIPRQVHLMFLMCGLSSSVINPVIYGVMNKTFRREYKTAFTCGRNGITQVHPSVESTTDRTRTGHRLQREIETLY